MGDQDAEPPTSTAAKTQNHKNCHRHDSTGLCFATRKNGNPCTYRATVFSDKFLPVCRQHGGWTHMMVSARCLALEACGHPCNRLAPVNEPYHLCRKHEHGTGTLPCPMMHLPVELRLMIFKYLFPAEIGAKEANDVNASILKINKQIYEEASSILYNETIFKAILDKDSVHLLGQEWQCKAFQGKKSFWTDMYDSKYKSGAQRIRHLDLCVDLGHFSRCNLRNIRGEEYEIYEARDTVRKLVQLLSPSHVSNSKGSKELRTLVVRPKLWPYNQWTMTQQIIVCFLTIEPLKSLKVDQTTLEDPETSSVGTQHPAQHLPELVGSAEYLKLKKEWLDWLSDTSMVDCPPGPDTATLVEAFRQIEHVARHVKEQQVAVSHCWLASAFSDIEQLLHYARVAYENGDLPAMTDIQKLLAKTWVMAHQKLQNSLLETANLFNVMFDDENDEADLRDIYPRSFHIKRDKKFKQPSDHPRNRAWTLADLRALDTAPSCSDLGLQVMETSLRVTIRKSNQSWIRLKTPEVLKELEQLKKRKPESTLDAWLS